MCVVPRLLTFKFHAILILCVIESLRAITSLSLCAESTKNTNKTSKERITDIAKDFCSKV